MEPVHTQSGRLQFNRDAWRITGITLLTEEDITYDLVFAPKPMGVVKVCCTCI
jgi:hypothetical protein